MCWGGFCRGANEVEDGIAWWVGGSFGFRGTSVSCLVFEKGSAGLGDALGYGREGELGVWEGGVWAGSLAFCGWRV